jgi:serine protease inhibitor
MKTFCFTTTIVVLLLLCINGLQAQTTQTKVDQLKVMQLELGGSWQLVISKDSVISSEMQQYGNAFVRNVYLVVNDKESFLGEDIILYSPKNDKFIGFSFSTDGSYSTTLSSFNSEKKYYGDVVQNFNPEKVLNRFEGVYETPDIYSVTYFGLDSTKKSEIKFYRVK